MPDFLVKIVARENVRLWHDLWDSGAPSDAAIQASLDGSLGQARPVKAKNASDAADIAEQENPGFVAIRAATQRVG